MNCTDFAGALTLRLVPPWGWRHEGFLWNPGEIALNMLKPSLQVGNKGTARPLGQASEIIWPANHKTTMMVNYSIQDQPISIPNCFYFHETWSCSHMFLLWLLQRDVKMSRLALQIAADLSSCPSTIASFCNSEQSSVQILNFFDIQPSLQTDCKQVIKTAVCSDKSTFKFSLHRFQWVVVIFNGLWSIRSRKQFIIISLVRL